MLLYPDDPRATIHTETFYSVRHNEPIRIWCQCTRGYDHDTLPAANSVALTGTVKAPGSRGSSAPRPRNSPAAALHKPQ